MKIERKSYLVKRGIKPVTFVIFGGLQKRPGMPIYEFEKVTEKFDINRIYIKDLAQCWYMNGIINPNPKTGMIHSLIDLKYILSPFENTKKIFIGNSSGGYMALLSGAIFEAEKTIAISPQTFLNAQKRKKHRDNRFQKYIKNTHNSIAINKKFFDLKLIYNYSKSEIHYSEIDRLDRIHAERMFKAKKKKYQFGNHNTLAKDLRNNGMLYKILKEGIANE